MIALLAAPALAFEVLRPQIWGNEFMPVNCTNTSFLTLPGSSSTFLSFTAPDARYTAAERDALIAGAEVWNAGSGTVNRGANWTYSSSGTTSAAVSLTDTVNRLGHMTEATGVAAYGQANGWDAFAGVRADPTCSYMLSYDVTVNDDESWTTGLPSAGSALSLTAAATHEFGHVLGLAHETFTPSLMTRHKMAEFGSEIRLHEDDYMALRTLKANGSTGKNFMLSKWEDTGGTGGRNADERWIADEAGSRWTGRCGTVALAVGPRPIYAVVNGTAASYASVPIEWTLSNDTTCFDADDITIGTRSPTLSPDTGYLVGPSGDVYTIPASTPDGDYWVCAGINPDQTQSEAQSAFSDNTIRSEGKWTIDCP